MSFPLREEDGWTGGFTRDHTEGAYDNGTPVVKFAFEEGDSANLDLTMMVQFFHSVMKQLNTLAAQTDTMPAFVDSMAVMFADVLVEDVKPELADKLLEIFARRVGERMKDRKSEAELKGVMTGLMDALTKAGVLDALREAVAEPEKPTDGETKH